MFMLLAVFGEYFSHKFLQANIAKEYYTRQKNAWEISDKNQKKFKEDNENPALGSRKDIMEELEQNFEEIDISEVF